jgi:hypothetical protein
MSRADVHLRAKAADSKCGVPSRGRLQIHFAGGLVEVGPLA